MKESNFSSLVLDTTSAFEHSKSITKICIWALTSSHHYLFIFILSFELPHSLAPRRDINFIYPNG